MNKLEKLNKLLENKRIEEKRLSESYEKNFNRLHAIYEGYKKKVGWNYLWANRMITDKSHLDERNFDNRKLLPIIQTMKEPDYFDAIKKEKVIYRSLKQIRSSMRKLTNRIKKLNESLKKKNEFQKRHDYVVKLEQNCKNIKKENENV